MKNNEITAPADYKTIEAKYQKNLRFTFLVSIVCLIVISSCIWKFGFRLPTEEEFTQYQTIAQDVYEQLQANEPLIEYDNQKFFVEISSNNINVQSKFSPHIIGGIKAYLKNSELVYEKYDIIPLGILLSILCGLFLSLIVFFMIESHFYKIYEKERNEYWRYFHKIISE